MPTVVVPRQGGPSAALPRAERDDLDDLQFTPRRSASTMSWAESLAANYTDAVLVLHRGRIVQERYFGVMAPDRLHTALSVTKGVLGLLAEMLIADGTLDHHAPVAGLVPELAASGFGNATIGQLLDMSTALDYREGYADPQPGRWASPTWRSATNGSGRRWPTACRPSRRCAGSRPGPVTSRCIRSTTTR